MALHQHRGAAGGTNSARLALKAKADGRPFAGISEVGQSLLVEPEALLMITLQPGHGPKPGKGTGNTR